MLRPLASSEPPAAEYAGSTPVPPGRGTVSRPHGRAAGVPKGVVSRITRRLVSILGTVLALGPVMAVRALRPLVLIRFGAIQSDRIGDFAIAPEYYLCQREMGTQNATAVDVFYYSHHPVCNGYLKAMVDRTLHMWGPARWLDRVNRRVPGGSAHNIDIIRRGARHFGEIHRLLSDTNVHLSFSDDEEKLGVDRLTELGVPKGAPFVCFHVRDSAYLDVTYPERDWSYHDFRDSNVYNYLPAVEQLATRGCYAMRMGSVVKEPLATGNAMIVDYATRGRTEFLDVFLSARCRFFISSSTGIDSVANSFRRPIACVNHLPLGNAQTWGPLDLFIPKAHWLRSEGRLMSFPEILQSGAARFTRGEEYEERGIDVVENSPEEITALVMEMDDRLRETWRGEAEDDELQQRFWSLFPIADADRPYLPRIGAEFLRRNRGLLE